MDVIKNNRKKFDPECLRQVLRYTSTKPREGGENYAGSRPPHVMRSEGLPTKGRAQGWRSSNFFSHFAVYQRVRVFGPNGQLPMIKWRIKQLDIVLRTAVKPLTVCLNKLQESLASNTCINAYLSVDMPVNIISLNTIAIIWRLLLWYMRFSYAPQTPEK